MLGVDIPDFLAATRDGYDRTAAMYAERFHQHLDDKPVDQAVLSAFAGLISKGRNTNVIDVGCGTGATTASLDGCGLNVSGVDVSANMLTDAKAQPWAVVHGGIDDQP